MALATTLAGTAAWRHDPVARWLVQADEATIAELLRIRPDLAVPAPGSLAELAGRAVSPPSVERCLQDLDQFTTQVLYGAVVAGTGAAVEQLQDLFAGQVGPDDLDRALHHLEAHALVRRSAGTLTLPTVLSESNLPTGLGPRASEPLSQLTVEQLRAQCTAMALRPASGLRKAQLIELALAWYHDAEAIRATFRSAPEDAQLMAAQLAAGPPIVTDGGATPFHYQKNGNTTATRSPTTWLADHGLILVHGWYSFVMPCEVALALRGGRLYERVAVTCPPLQVTSVAAADVDATAELAAISTVEAVEAVVEAWGSRPAATLKSGGVGIRELKKLAQHIDRTVEDTTVLVELAGQADLVTTDTRQGEALPTVASDNWLALDLPERWAALVAAWLAAPAYAGLAGTVDHAGKPRAALYEWGPLPMAADQRRAVLGVLAELPPGSAVGDPASLLHTVWWRHPGLVTIGPGDPARHVLWVTDEARLLGVVASGSLSKAGRAAVAGDFRAAAAAIERAAGSPTTDLVLQNDLTAVVPGRTTAAFRQQMETLADVESTGVATVYRFSETSLRRAFDAGYSAADIHRLLEAHAVKGVPQPLLYLVDDVARRHGRIRVGTASCYVTFDDPADAAGALRAKQTARIGLRQIAPTVLVAAGAPGPVLSALRAAGFFPVEEAENGAPVTVASQRRRARQGRAFGATTSPAPSSTSHGAGDGTGDSATNAPVEAAGNVEAEELARTLVAGGRPDPDDPAEARVEARQLAAELEELIRQASDDPDTFDWTRGPVDRPTEIAKGARAAADLLELADDQEWMVRLSYITAQGKQVELSAAVTGVAHKYVTVDRLPTWKELRIPLDSLVWVRVLTETEEDRYL